MAPVILHTKVHCEDCAKKIRKTLKKVPGVTDVLVVTESNLVAVDGTADPEDLRARLEKRVGRTVTVVSDSTVEPASSSPPSRPARAPPLVLEMDLHSESRARKVKKVAMKIPGVESVTADVATGRVEVVGDADASTVARIIGVKARRSVKVVRGPSGTDFTGYEHERRQTTTTEQEREPEPTPPPVAQEYTGAGGYTVQHWGATAPDPAPPTGGGYGGYYQEQGQGYGAQHYWSTAPTGGGYGGPYYYTGQDQVYGGAQQWTSSSSSSEGYYGYGGQQWTAPPNLSSLSYHHYPDGPPGDCVYDQYQYPYHHQTRDENDAGGSNCSIQ